MGGGDETAEVGVALAGLGQKDEVMGVGGGVGVWGAAVGPAGAVPAAPTDAPLAASRSAASLHPHLGAEDRLDAPLGAGLGEADGAVKAVVVGEGQGRLPEFGRPGHQLLDAAAPVQEREVRVDVQVHERGRGAVGG